MSDLLGSGEGSLVPVPGGLADGLGFLGDAIKNGLADIPVLGNVGSLLGGLLGGSQEVPITEVPGTGLSGLLIDVGDSLQTATEGIPLVGEVGNLVEDLVGTGQGDLLPTPVGLADLTDAIGDALGGSVPQDIPLISDVTSLLSGTLGRVPQAGDMMAEVIDQEQLPDILSQINNIDMALFGAADTVPFVGNFAPQDADIDLLSSPASINSYAQSFESVVVQNADFS